MKKYIHNLELHSKSYHQYGLIILLLAIIIISLFFKFYKFNFYMILILTSMMKPLQNTQSQL